MIDAMKQALEALKRLNDIDGVYSWESTEQALRQAIEQAEKQYGWVLREVYFEGGEPLAHREPQESALQEMSDIGQEIEQEKMCVDCGKPTMHMGNKCYRCCQTTQPEQEPVAWMFEEYGESSGGMRWFKCLGTEKPQHPESIYRNIIPLYTAPPKREWVSLSDEDKICAKYLQDAPDGIAAVIEYIEAKSKELNT